MSKNKALYFYIGVVAPLGVNKDLFIDALKKCSKQLNINFNDDHRLELSKLIEIPPNQIQQQKSFEIYAKMQIFSQLRLNSNLRCRFGKTIIQEIQYIRNLMPAKKQINIIVIDELKNEFESQLLSFVYGQNYIQVGLFASQIARNAALEKKFTEDLSQNIRNPDNQSDANDLLVNATIRLEQKCQPIYQSQLPDDVVNKIKEITKRYSIEIKTDCSCNLLKKDFLDNDEYLSEAGQSVSKIYHRSHFFFNLESSESILNEEVQKLLKILQSNYTEYPTQSEFAMALATQTSVRSNFPNNRYIGAAILSQDGEVISTGSIRSPSPSSNTTRIDKEKIQTGYNTYKSKIEEWKSLLTALNNLSSDTSNSTKNELFQLLSDEYELVKASNEKYKNKNLKQFNGNLFKELRKFVADSLEFHPCTHAEISAILDAAKLGISIKGATLYSTTYPCHLCAKDIITAGIRKVVYLEPYPKSKNEELYPNNITDCEEGHTGKIIFSPFFGVGPERFHQYYSENNKNDEDNNIIARQQLKYISNSAIDANEMMIISYKPDNDNNNDPLRQLLEIT